MVAINYRPEPDTLERLRQVAKDEHTSIQRVLDAAVGRFLAERETSVALVARTLAERYRTTLDRLRDE